MGWRVSYYQADKTQPLKHHRDKDGREWVEVNGKEVMRYCNFSPIKGFKRIRSIKAQTPIIILPTEIVK